MLIQQLESHISSEKAQAILDYLKEHNCTLKVVRPRKTKKGDFRTNGTVHHITVNQTENRFRFLLTLIHEIAHLKTFIDHGAKARPHGSEWKTNFRLLFSLFNLSEEFGQDDDLLMAILYESKNASACSGVDYNLEKALSKFDLSPKLLLADIPNGGEFIFREKHYRKVVTRRTRALCLNIQNNRKYTISLASPIVPC